MTNLSYDSDTIEGYLSDIDRLMTEDPLNLSIDKATPGGRKLSAIIAYNRNIRAMREEGKGRAARKATTPATKLNIAELMQSMVKAAPSGGQIIKRRV